MKTLAQIKEAAGVICATIQLPGMESDKARQLDVAAMRIAADVLAWVAQDERVRFDDLLDNTRRELSEARGPEIECQPLFYIRPYHQSPRSWTIPPQGNRPMLDVVCAAMHWCNAMQNQRLLLQGDHDFDLLEQCIQMMQFPLWPGFQAATPLQVSEALAKMAEDRAQFHKGSIK